MLSIIIVNWNSWGELKNCLISITKWAPRNSQVLVVDNNSNQKVRGLKLSNHSLQVIYEQNNLGFGKACNLGASLAKGEYLLFLNPDTELVDDSLSKMLNYFKEHSGVGAVGPKLLDNHGKIANQGYYLKPLSLGQLLFFYTRLVRYFHDSKILRKWFLDQSLGQKLQLVESIPGAALMVRRFIFDRVGGFDENFFLWFEDIDLCRRIKQAGYQLVYLPEAKLIHSGGVTFSRWRDDTRKRTQMLASLDLYVKKHQSMPFYLSYWLLFQLTERGLVWLKTRLKRR